MEDLRSTIVGCIVAIALYFFIGLLVFPLWLEPSWTLVDALYFSMVTLTTVVSVSQWYVIGIFLCILYIIK